MAAPRSTRTTSSVLRRRSSSSETGERNATCGVTITSGRPTDRCWRLGLALDDIERCPGELSGIETADERVVVDETLRGSHSPAAASSGIRDEGVVDQMTRRFDQRHVEDDDVGLGPKHVERHLLHAGGRLGGDGSAAITRQPKPASLRAVARPMRPRPTSPTVRRENVRPSRRPAARNPI